MELDQVMQEAYAYGRQFLEEGKVADYIPELAKEDPSRVGLTIFDPNFARHSMGDAEYKFSAQSIAKIILYLCVLEEYDFSYVRQFIGVTPSSKPFNSILELELSDRKVPVNPFINAGAIVSTALLMEKYRENTFERICSRARQVMENEHLDYSHAIFRSETDSAYANRALTYMLLEDGIIQKNLDVEDLLSAYFRSCSLLVNTVDLAKMGVILSQEGRNDKGEQVMNPNHAVILRTVMATCGTYDFAGDFALLVGLPAKSGVGGGFVATSQAGYGIGVFSPKLDSHGNSYVGIRILECLSQRLHLSIY